MRIWFRLLETRDSRPYETLTLTVVVRPAADVTDFHIAVKQLYADSRLAGVSPDELPVYRSREAYGRGEQLEEDVVLTGLGALKNDALLVAVVPRIVPQSTSEGTRVTFI